MRRAAIQRGVIGVIDIGSYKVAALVLKLEPGEARTTHRVSAIWLDRLGFRVIGRGDHAILRCALWRNHCHGRNRNAPCARALQAAQKMARNARRSCHR